MKVDVYRGDSLLRETTVTEEEIEEGYTTIECPSCRGTGVFNITDADSQDCVECSTEGRLIVPL